MRGERGQATIEWIGAVLMVALALAALARLADRVEAAGLGAAVLAHDDLRGPGRMRATGGHRSRHPPPAAEPSIAPPLVPLPGTREASDRESDPAGRRPRPRADPAGAARAGALWRRAWLLCLVYERVR